MPLIPVQPTLRRAARRWLRSAGVAFSALLLVTCSTDSPVGPGRPGIGSLRLAPVFDAFARVAPLTLDNVRVIVVRAPAETLAVVPRAFNPNNTQLQLNIPVFLQSVSEDLLVTLELYAGSTLLFTGTRTLRVTQGSATPPDSIPVAYQGPGSQVTTLVISPRDTTLRLGASFPFTVNATDGQQLPVAQYYVSWSTVGAPTGTKVDGSGILTAPSVRDTFFVKVVTPNGVVDSTSVITTAAPSTLVKTGGDGQTALVGTTLPQLLAVQVNGTDGLPVAGATVTFAAGIGGGTVDSATATADAQGVARSGAILGATVGAQTFIASAVGLTSVTFNETGASGTGSVTWTGATDGNWSTASNWNPAAVPLATNDVVIPPGMPNSPVLSTTVTIHDLTVQTGASLGLNDNDLLLSGNLDASGNVVGCCTETVRMTASGSVRGNLSDVILDVPAGVVVTLSGTTTLTTNGSVSINGELILNGHTLDIGLANGTLFTNVQTGLVTMTNAADLLIARDATFNGGDETGHLTAGVIQTQNLIGGGSVPTSFFASGTHKVKLGGAGPSTVGLAVPASARLQNLDVSGVSTTLTLFSNITMAGQLISHPSATAPVITASVTPKVITAGGVDVNGLGIDQNTLAIGAGPVTQFDNVAFTGQAATATALTVANAGTATPFAFNGLSFAVAPTTGFYLAANDLDGATPNPLTINMVGATPAAPSASLFSATNGAVINWPPAGSLVWTGTTSTDWSLGGNWSTGVVPNNTSDVVIPSGTPNQPSITTSCSAKSLTVNAGATLSLGAFNCQVGGNVFADGSITGSGAIQIATAAQLRGNVPNLILSGAVTLVGRTVLSGSATITNGSLIAGGHTVTMAGSLITQGAGVLTMTNPLDTVLVASVGTFGGGDETVSLTAGYLKIGGSFAQTSANSGASFAASGTHRTEIGAGGVRIINFASPGAGAGTSHFNDLIVNGAAGGINLAANTFVNGQLISHPTGATPVIGVVAAVKVLTVGGVDVSALGVDQNVMTIGAGTITQFDNVAFTGQANGITQLTINNAGAATPSTFNGLSFAVAPTTGLYLLANDIDGATPNALTINMVGATPAAPSGALFSGTGGAVINWPAAGGGSWTGTVSTNWSIGGNWSTGSAPTAGDNVVIPSGTPFAPVLTANSTAKGVTVNAGATLGLGGFTLTTSGNVDATGAITGTGTVDMVVAGTVKGTMPNLQVDATVTVAGPLTVSGNLAVGTNGFLNFGGQTTVVGGTLSDAGFGLFQMTSALDNVTAKNVLIDGQDETGRMTAGTLTVTGNFTETGRISNDFNATGTHLTIVGGGVTAGLIDAGTGASFNDFRILPDAGGITLVSGLTVRGRLLANPGSTTPPTVSAATSQIINADQAVINQLTLNNVRLSICLTAAPPAPVLNGLVFNAMDPTATQLVICGAGSATPVPLAATFNTTPTTGRYLQATDNDGAIPFPLVIDVTAVPTSPGGKVVATNGAIINWPATGALKTWTGASGTDWFNAGNWSPVGVPSASDSAVIAPATAAPTLTANVSVGAVVVTSGSPVLNGHTMTVARTFGTANSGTVTMQNPNDSLVVAGSVTFAGGDESTRLTAGILLVGGDFTQLGSNSTRSFAPSGTQVIGFNGSGVQTISFANPGPGLSGFHGLGISNPVGGLTLVSDVYISGGSAYVGTAPKIVHGGGHTIQFQQINVTGVTFDNALVNLTNGTFLNFDNNTFQNYAPTATVLTMSDPGAATPFTFNNLTFTVAPTTGFYLRADDNVADANVLTIDMAGANPVSGAPFFQTTGGAVVNWPAAGSLIWTGGTSSDWSTASNWNLNRVPTSVDDATIGIGTPFQPKLSVSSAINNLLINAGAVVDLDTTILVVVGNLDNNGSITGVAGTAGVSLAGTGKTVHGSIGVDVVIAPADYTLNGNLTVLNLSIAGANGSLNLAGNQLTTTLGFSTLNNGVVIMTNPASVLVVGGAALFAGGDETGKITGGLLQVAGDFSQVPFTSQSSFAASGTHLTQINGTVTQTINVPDTALSFFHDLQITNLAGANVQSLVRVQGSLDIAPGVTISALNGAPFFPGFNVSGNVTTGSGSTLNADRLFVGGTLSASGSFNVTQTIFTGFGQTAPSNLAYQQLWAYGTVTMTPGPLSVTDLVVSFPASTLTLSGPTAVSGNILLGNLGGGNLKLNGNQVIVAGALTVDGNSTLTMQSANDSLVVGGTANFIGGSETGLMTAGVLELHGGLKQTAANNTTSFAPSGTHKTVINSATAQLLDFGSPGAGTGGSHFQVLDLSGATGGASLTVNSIADSVISTNAAAKLSSSGSSLTMRRAQISGLTADNTTLILDEQGAFSTENLSGITFQGFGTTGVTMLKILGPGSSAAARPVVTTTNVNFQSLPIGAGNFYVDLTSTNSAGFGITMTGSNQRPNAGGNGPTLTKTSTGATVTWP